MDFTVAKSVLLILRFPVITAPIKQIVAFKKRLQEFAQPDQPGNNFKEKKCPNQSNCDCFIISAPEFTSATVQDAKSQMTIMSL